MFEDDLDGTTAAVVPDYTVKFPSNRIIGLTVCTVVRLLAHVFDRVTNGVVSPFCEGTLDDDVTAIVISPNVPIMLRQAIQKIRFRRASCRFRGTYALAHLYPPWVVVE